MISRKSLQTSFERNTSQLPDFVLYYQDKCPTSMSLKKTISDASKPRPVFHLQDVALLPYLPPWLTGTPILVNTAESRIFEGTDAVLEVEELLLSDLQTVSNNVTVTDDENVDDDQTNFFNARVKPNYVETSKGVVPDIQSLVGENPRTEMSDSEDNSKVTECNINELIEQRRSLGNLNPNTISA